MLVFTRWYPGGNFTLCIHVMAPDFKSSTQLLIGAAIGTDGKPMPLPSLVAYTVCTQLFGCSPYTLAAARQSPREQAHGALSTHREQARVPKRKLPVRRGHQHLA